jgi:hypothetical protein
MRTAWCIALALLIFLLAFSYRFTTMGGRLGGFENDQFVHLSRAQQIVLGERPIRDFVTPGMPLTDALSAAAQAMLGPTLLSEAMLTMSMLALASALLFLLAERASGSMPIAATVALVQIAMAPRFYNYPKLLPYAFGIAAMWWYIDRPQPRRLAMLACAGVVAFLFRHDHGAYIGTAAIVTVVAVHWRQPRRLAREVALLGAMALAMVSPYLVYAQINGGIPEYFRTAFVFATRDATRTGLDLPAFSVDPSQPLIRRLPRTPVLPHINVRWAPGITADVRTEREQAHHLTVTQQVNGDVWSYAVADFTPVQLQAIVHDPTIADTQGIDRGTFVINDPDFTRQPTAIERLQSSLRRLRVLPGYLREPNAVPFLYYLLIAVPVAALAVAAWPRPLTGSPIGPLTGWPAERLKIGVVAALALLMAAGILRGNLSSRLADVTEVVGVLAAWLTALVLARRSRSGRSLARLAVALVFICTALSVGAVEDVSAQVAQSGIEDGLPKAVARARAVRETLSGVPPITRLDAESPGMGRLARYIAACTVPSERVFAFAYAQELFFLSGRGFAGGHVWYMPGFYTSEGDQRLIVQRIRARTVPIAVIEPEPLYSQQYRRDFPIVDQFLRDEYREAGIADLGGGVRFRVLARNDLQPLRTYEPLNLPCFQP